MLPWSLNTKTYICTYLHVCVFSAWAYPYFHSVMHYVVSFKNRFIPCDPVALKDILHWRTEKAQWDTYNSPLVCFLLSRTKAQFSRLLIKLSKTNSKKLIFISPVNFLVEQKIIKVLSPHELRILEQMHKAAFTESDYQSIKISTSYSDGQYVSRISGRGLSYQLLLGPFTAPLQPHPRVYLTRHVYRLFPHAHTLL